jgi:uncharacterized protein (TIGR00297 family)
MFSFGIQEIMLLAFLLAVMVLCYQLKKLTFSGSVAAGFIGCVVYLADHYRGVFLLLFFLIISVIATSHKKHVKLALYPSSTDTKGRTAGQVFANGGVAALCALLSLAYPLHSLIFIVMMASSLASALADTLSSELGVIYGQRFFNILSLKPDVKGLDGVVSIEGTLIGASGAFLVGICFTGFTTIAVIIGIAGMLGNLFDSVSGATLERKGLIGNNFVNFLNTLFAALIGFMLFLFINN